MDRRSTLVPRENSVVSIKTDDEWNSSTDDFKRDRLNSVYISPSTTTSEPDKKKVQTVTPPMRLTRRTSKSPKGRRSKVGSLSVKMSETSVANAEERPRRKSTRKSISRSFVRYVTKMKQTQDAVKNPTASKQLVGIMKKSTITSTETMSSNKASDVLKAAYSFRDADDDDDNEPADKPSDSIQLSSVTKRKGSSFKEDVERPPDTPTEVEQSSNDTVQSNVSLQDGLIKRIASRDMSGGIRELPGSSMGMIGIKLMEAKASTEEAMASTEEAMTSTEEAMSDPSEIEPRQSEGRSSLFKDSFIDNIMRGDIERHFKQSTAPPSCRKCLKRPSSFRAVEEPEDKETPFGGDNSSWQITFESDTGSRRSSIPPGRISSRRLSGGFVQATFLLRLSVAKAYRPLLYFLDKQDGHLLKFKWRFLNRQDSLDFRYRGEGNDVMPLRCKRDYDFTMNEDIYLYLDKIGLRFELYVTNSEDMEVIVGRADLKVGGAMERVGEHFKATLAINNSDLSRCYGIERETFGELICKYGFHGEAEEFEKCRPKEVLVKIPPPRGSGSYGDLLAQTSTTQWPNRSQSGFLRTLDQEQQTLQDGLGLLLSRNKALHTTQEEIAKELQERAVWLHRELEWKVTLQENAILSGHDPHSVKWRQWRDEHTEHVKYLPYGNRDYKGEAVIDFLLEDLYLYPGTSTTADDSIAHVYLEFTFLNFDQSETPSTPRLVNDDGPLIFDWRMQFTLVEDSPESRRFAELVKNREALVVTAVSQPLESTEIVKSCYDFGYCELNFFDLLHHRVDSCATRCTLYDSYTQEEIGLLNATVSGLKNARTLALYELKPDTFDLYK